MPVFTSRARYFEENWMHAKVLHENVAFEIKYVSYGEFEVELVHNSMDENRKK